VGCFDLGVTTDGAWSDTDGVVANFHGTDFSRTTDHLVNIRLETASRFSGQIRLPEGFAARGDEFVFVRISSNDRFAFSSFLVGEILTNSDTSSAFEIGVPSDETSQSWNVEFGCLSCDDDILGDDVFASTITGNPAVTDENLAFAFPRSGNVSGLTLTLISLAPPEPKPVTIAPILFLLND